MPINLRSTFFAFTCRLGNGPLTVNDLNPVIGDNTAHQVYSTREGDTVFVCVRLEKAISRQTLNNALLRLQNNHVLAFQMPRETTNWKDIIFMGRAELTTGPGLDITRTIKADMIRRSMAYNTSVDPAARANHLLTHTLLEVVCPLPAETRAVSPVAVVSPVDAMHAPFSPPVLVDGRPIRAAAVVRMAIILTHAVSEIGSSIVATDSLRTLADLIRVEIGRI